MNIKTPDFTFLVQNRVLALKSLIFNVYRGETGF